VIVPESPPTSPPFIPETPPPPPPPLSLSSSSSAHAPVELPTAIASPPPQAQRPVPRRQRSGRDFASDHDDAEEESKAPLVQTAVSAHTTTAPAVSRLTNLVAPAAAPAVPLAVAAPAVDESSSTSATLLPLGDLAFMQWQPPVPSAEDVTEAEQMAVKRVGKRRMKTARPLRSQKGTALLREALRAFGALRKLEPAPVPLESLKAADLERMMDETSTWDSPRNTRCRTLFLAYFVH
jgi:hypothetical protein